MANEEHSIKKHSPGFVIPVGTQVVLKETMKVEGMSADAVFKKPGTVGAVTQCPHRADGRYEVEFADGHKVMAGFDELALRRREIDDELSEATEDLTQFAIYKCIVGSRAFGLSSDSSDEDIRGIYLPPARLHWSLYKLPGQIEELVKDEHRTQKDEVFWELEKFIRLALKANPNILEVMWSPMVLYSTPISDELREIRSSFLSKHVYKTYSGYVLSQFKKMKKSVQHSNQYKKKHAMHLIRLLYSGIHALKEHNILVDVGEHREELLDIRSGEIEFESVRMRALQLEREFQDAFEKTDLPEQPDYRLIDDFLIRARKSVVESD